MRFLCGKVGGAVTAGQLDDCLRWLEWGAYLGRVTRDGVSVMLLFLESPGVGIWKL